MEEDNDRVLYDLNILFDSKIDLTEKVNENANFPLRKLMSSPFSWYFIPNHISNPKPKKGRKSFSLNKFKELNTEKVMEDMMYYCAPVEILEKIDAQNGEDIEIGGEREFMEDLGIVSFLQNQEIISELMEGEDKVHQIIKGNNLKHWKDKLQNSDEIPTDNLDEINLILQLIENTLKKFSTKKLEKKEILENIEQMLSEIKKNSFNFENSGIKAQILIENNLLVLFGFINKYFGKDVEMFKFLEKYIQLFNILKSSRIFFAVIVYLNKNRSLAEKIALETPFEIFGHGIADIFYHINVKSDNILNLPKLPSELDCKSEEKENASNEEKNYWILNNSEELFLFIKSNTKPSTKLSFYRINLRNYKQKKMNENSDVEEETNFRVLDFGEINLSNSEDDEVYELNFSIKNDIIYICYFINKKLKIPENESNKFEFGFSYKLYTTSMILLKEEIIQSDKIEYQKSHLYSDKNNIYVISEENKVLVMKKEYSMNSFEMKDLTINREKIDIAFFDYQSYNNFNLENLLILENKKNKKDLLSVQIYKEENKYIFNLVPIKQVLESDINFKFTYNDNELFVIQIEDNDLSFCFSQNEPFDTNLMKDFYNVNKNCDAYKKLIKEYASFVNLFGNFDSYDLLKMSSNYNLCLNINTNNLNFIIEQILNDQNKEDMEIIYYYIIILKQFICCLYNAQLLDIKIFTKILEYFKNFIMDIKNKSDNKFRNKILKEITYISSYLNDTNIVEISDLEKILPTKDKEKDLKINLLLLDLLLTQPKTQQEPKLFELICEYDKTFLSYIYSENIEQKEENKIISSLFKLNKKVMNKAMYIMNNYYIKEDQKLFEYIKKVSENIIFLINLYQKKSESIIGKIPFIFNSLNFQFFYLIIKRRTINRKFIKDLEIFNLLYNALITLDRLNINKKMKKAFDLDNIIEISNSEALNDKKTKDQEEHFNVINFKSKKNIIFQSNLIDYLSSINFDEYFDRIILITQNENSIEIKKEIYLNHFTDEIFYDVSRIEIYFKEKVENSLKAIINIIPIKNVDEYLEFKNNENFKIINSIQKTLLYYFLFLMKQFDRYFDEFLKKVKNYSKIYNNEFLQFIYTNDLENEMNLLDLKKDSKSEDKKEVEKKEEEKKEEDKEEVEKKEEEKKEKDKKEEEEGKKDDDNIIVKIDNFISDLKYSLDLLKSEKDKEIIRDKNNINIIMELLNKYISFFEDFNRNGTKNTINFESYYNKRDITLNQIKSYKDINLEDKFYEKLFIQLEKDVAKKNRTLSSLRANESIKKIILKIFQIIIKYYNYNSKFLDLIKTENFSTKNENYNLFLDIYEKCCQMKMVYNQEKSRFLDDKFEEQSERYFKVTFGKLNFLYKIIIPSFNEKLKYDKSIVQSLIELIKNENFDPKDLLKYSELQNINCTIKEIELLIMDNLLLNLIDEENIKLILHTINDLYNKNKEDNKYSSSMSLLDSIYGADYSKMQQVKNYFHLLIGIILEKFIFDKTNYQNLGISTKILLYQSLLWKYKGRDFIIMPKILNGFEDLKKPEFDKDKILFDLGHEKVYRINNYNLEYLADIKYEIFKIISSQLFIKIKENPENTKSLTEETAFNLKRNLSMISNSDNILNILMKFFLEIQENNKYYFDLILFFYKNILNSPKLISILNSNKFYDVIIKILKIIFDDNDSFKDDDAKTKRNNYTKFIILKLFLRFLENTDTEDKIQNLTDCCTDYDKDAFNENDEEQNPFIYLIKKCNEKLNFEKCSFLNLYYLKLFLFCLNKIDKSDFVFKDNKLLDINYLLYLNENSNQLEQQFYTKSEIGNKFEEIALFSKNDNVKMGKKGTLLCFMENNSLFNQFIVNSTITYFDYENFIYNVQQINNCENIIVIMDEILKEKNINKINNLDIKDIKDIIIIPNQNSFLKNKYLEKNSKLICDKLMSKLIEDKLNYKGINYILKMIYNFLDYIDVENADKLINYIYNYLSNNDVENNLKEWEFCSYEYFENYMNSFKNIFYSSSFDINKENKKEPDKKIDTSIGKDKLEEAPLLLSSLFNYFLKNHNEFYIEYKSNSNLHNSFPNQIKLFNPNIIKGKQKENCEIKMSNLSFYKVSLINDSILITNDSLLLLNKLCLDQELLKIISENSGKIKAILVSGVDDSKKEEYNQFIDKITVPIYVANLNFFKKIERFFIEGIGGIYLNNSKKSKKEDNGIIPIYYPDLYLKNRITKNSDDKNNEKTEDNYYLDQDLDLDILFSEEENVNYLNDDKKNAIMLEYQNEIIKRYEELNFDINKIFCLENIKLCNRLLYELFQKENIIKNVNKKILDKNLVKSMELFNSLCREYYFNIKQNLPVHKLQNLLKSFLESLGKSDNFGKLWSQCFIKYCYKIITKTDEGKQTEEEKNEIITEKDKTMKNDIEVKKEKEKDDSDKKTENKEILILENCKIFDVLLFIFKNCYDLLLDKNTINIYYEIINYIFEDAKVGKIENKNNLKIKMINNEFITYFLFEWLNALYSIIINNKQISKLLIECFITNDKFNYFMLKFIDEEIDIKNYFVKEGKNMSEKISKNQTLLVQFGIKYLDICFYIFFKQKQYSIIKYWLKNNNDFYYFYSSYKMLSTDKHYDEIDYKELLSIIAYISDAILCFKKVSGDKNKYNSINKTLELKENEFNKITLDLKDDKNFINMTSFSFEGLDNSKDKNLQFNKLAIFTYNRKDDTYHLQDIIDTSENSSIKSSKVYFQMFNENDIYLVPLDKLSTSIYAFGSNFNHSLGINGKLAKYYDKPTKCEGLPKNIWNFGYGNSYCLALCEDSKKIYACGCNRGGGFNSTPRATFTDDTKINKNKDSNIENKYINFATGNCDSTLLLNEMGELVGIGNNQEKIFGFEGETTIKHPKKLDMKIWAPKEKEEEEEEKKEKEINEIKEKKESKIEKIKSLYIGYKNSYIINEEGKLFGIGNNENNQISSDSTISYENWKNIPLPKDCTKFIDVAVGENYILCLIEDKEGNSKIYGRGINDNYQCGISEQENINIKSLTICDNIQNINFKKIYSRNKESAAISIDGDLYILNKENQKFTLVSFEEKKVGKNENISHNAINEIREENMNTEDKKIIVDDVAITTSHILIIARKYDKDKGIYIRKLFGYGDNSKGSLGLPIKQNKEDNIITSITEIPLIDENNKNLIPIKLAIGNTKSYVLCLNEDNLINTIKENKKQENHICNINISNIFIEKEEKNILDFYYSKNVDLFINLFKSITNKVMSNFIEAIDEIKMINQDRNDKEEFFSVDFPIFYDYINKHQNLIDLNHIFIQTNASENNINLNLGIKPEIESIFNYLKTKSRFITSDLLKICDTNEKSEYKQFLQKAIGNNLLYLNAKVRMDKFEQSFSKLNKKHGTDRRVEVDRFKANIFYDKFNENLKNRIPDIELNQTIFGQVFQKFGKTKGEDFLIRNNNRLFIVCLKNEYASDQGGPYHEVMTQMCQELQNDYLNMFIKTPNNKHGLGSFRDKYIPNPDAKMKIYEDAYEFVGKLMASSIASGEALDLNLHPVVWSALLGNEISFFEYDNIDHTFYSLINNLEKELKIECEESEKEEKDNITNSLDNNNNNKEDEIIEEKKHNFQEMYNLNFVIKNSNETDIELKPEGEKILVTLDNLKEYIDLSKKMRTTEFLSQMEFIKKGFYSVIPSSIFQHLYWRQLEELVCGKSNLDIKSFKKNTKYEGFNEKDEVIEWFWNWLSKCDEHEQSLYLKFVSGRSRLPKDKNFKYNHIIAKNDYHSHDSFPNSSTCFFTLKLPVYKDKETLEKKMNYAIQNCDEIDADN